MIARRIERGKIRLGKTEKIEKEWKGNMVRLGCAATVVVVG